MLGYLIYNHFLIYFQVEIVNITKFSMIAKVIQEEKDWVSCTSFANNNQTLKVDGSCIKIVSEDEQAHSLNFFLLCAIVSCGIALICRYLMFSM